MTRDDETPRFEMRTRPEPAVAAPQDLSAPATQIVRDREDYLGQGSAELGRRISDEQVELFVAIDPAPAIQQQLERLAPEYIALHDIGPSASLRLLSALASAAGARVQRLSVRRQGHGVPLALLPFVEVGGGDGQRPLRIYSTDIEAERDGREAIARVLLAHARLAVLMVGDLPAAALARALAPLGDAMARGPWPNRELLMLPLGSATTLAAHAAELGRHSSVAVRVTPHASRPQEAWAFVSGSWNRLAGSGERRLLDTDLQRALPRKAMPQAEAPTEPMGLDPLGAPRPGGPAAASPTAPARPGPRVVPAVPAGIAPASWSEYLVRCAALRGALAGCVVETGGRRLLARFGALPAEALVDQGLAVLDAAQAASRALGFPAAPPDTTVSAGEHHLLLRGVPGHPGTVLLLALEASSSHLTLARLQLDRLAAPPAG